MEKTQKDLEGQEYNKAVGLVDVKEINFSKPEVERLLGWGRGGKLRMSWKNKVWWLELKVPFRMFKGHSSQLQDAVQQKA